MDDVRDNSISVIVPAFDAESTIEACLDSVLEAGCPDLELIVVDDCSGDGTKDHVTAKAARDHRVNYLRMERRSGPAAARNAGARAASKELLFFLDSDATLESGALERFVLAMREADAVVGVYSAFPTNEGVVPAYKAILNHYLFSRRGPIEYESFNTAVGGIRASVFREVGGFDDRIEWGMDYEAEELADRIRRRHRLLLDPSIQARHVFPGFSSLTRNYFNRVSHWMERFPEHSFESGGTASRSIGFATASSAAALGALPLTLLGILPWLVPALLLLPWLVGYFGAFAFIARNRARLLPVAVALNLFFNFVISCGAAHGVAHRLFWPRIAPRLDRNGDERHELEKGSRG